MKLKKVLSILLGASLCLSNMTIYAQSTITSIEDIVTNEGISEIPGTLRMVKDYDRSFLSVSGFAEGKVNDRTEYIGTSFYREVKNEREFLDAILDAQNGDVKVIEIQSDLNLGWKALSLTKQEVGKYRPCISKYKEPSNGYTNPDIEECGVSQLKISGIDGLTIFSKYGNTIKHAELQLQRGSTDIILRNLAFDGMWQWDDTGKHKEAGWTPLKINGGVNVWIDHCSFAAGADGLLDLENGASGVTLSWCKFGLEADETPSSDSAIYQSIKYMEKRYQNNDLGEESRYYKLRSNGTTMNEVMAYAAYHSKANLSGSGDKDYMDYVRGNGEVIPDGNQRIEVSVAYSHYINVGQRVPMVRQGKGHLYNVYIDDSTHMDIHNNNEVFKEYGGYPLSRCLNARNGASVAADTCVFDGVEEPIVGSERQGRDISNMNAPWNELFKNVLNHSLIVNSQVINDYGNYIGSSWDNNGDNLFTRGFDWENKSTIGQWAWSSSIIGTENMHKDKPPTEPFEFKYGYDEKLPYEYNIVPLEDVVSVITEYAGAGCIDLTPEEWIMTEYEAEEAHNEYNVNIKEIENGVIKASPLKVREGTEVLVKVIADEGYRLKQDTLKVNDALIQNNMFIMPGKDVGITVEFEEIPANERVTGIRLNADSVTITTGSSITLTETVEPRTAMNKEVDWESSNEKVATVEDGVVTALSNGETTITVTTADGGFTTSCVVKVDDEVVKVTGISLDMNEVEITTSSSIQLIGRINPENATNKIVNWTSSNEDVATVENGVVTALSNGETTITVTTAEGNFTDTCEVVVDLEYDIEIELMRNGTVKTDLSNAQEGTIVNVTVMPKSGYELKRESLKYNGNQIKNNQFEMPDENVTITAQFNLIEDDSSDWYGGGIVSKPQTTQEVIIKLSNKDKESIIQNFKEYSPYTSLTSGVSIEKLKELTNNKFTSSQLEEIIKKPEVLKVLGIDLVNFVERVELIPVKNANFSDITEKHWANESIKKAAELGLVKGMLDGTFAPDQTLQVADTFTFLDRVLLLNDITDMKLPRSTVEKYAVDKENWAFSHVASIGSKLSEETLITISRLENKAISRGLLAQVLYEITDSKIEKVSKSVEFVDTKNTPYEEAIAYCVQTGLLNGMGNRIMKPENTLTRAELMTVLIRLNSTIK